MAITSNKIKLKKTLYVGLGGTGVSAILKTKKCFIDTYGEVPPMIGFLAIDTDRSAYNAELTGKRGESIKFTNNELLVCTVRQPLQTYQNNPLEFDWIPPINIRSLSSITGNGAGQIRSNGRFIARYNERQIANAVTTAINSINGLIPLQSKYEVDIDQHGLVHPTAINVACSVAGGSGSGMIVDTLCIIEKAMNQVSQGFYIYPWIVLPEVFKAMNSGPSMHNVLYNSFGALKELDYLMHLTPDQPPLDFGYTLVNESPARFAFLINNTSTAGTTYSSINDITDILGMSMFLPSNAMGDQVLSPFDNILTFRTAGTYDIINKNAWAASVGSSELFYDNQAVGRAINFRIGIHLCRALQAFKQDGNKAANSFVDHAEVLIRENNGRDDVIDALLDPNDLYSFHLDINTTETDILNYIAESTGRSVSEKIKSNYDRKLDVVSKQLKDKIASEANGSNGISSSMEFLSSLHIILSVCREEMVNEKTSYPNEYAIDWSQRLLSIKSRGLKAFINPISEEQSELVKQELVQYITDKREVLRREWAIRFYNEVLTEIDSYIEKFENLKNRINEIANEKERHLVELQQKSASNSRFSIFLHESDVLKASIDPEIDYALDFVSYLAEKGGIVEFLNKTKPQIQESIDEYCKETPTVVSAVNVSIEDKLSQMDPETVTQYLNRLNELAAPLWTHDALGYRTSQNELDQFVIVGVGNADSSIVNSNYKSVFRVSGNEPKFASTHQTDRIVVMRVENLLPIYAVNNLPTYKREEERGIANYLDEKWKSRMDRESYKVNPTPQKNNVLELWVYGFIFEYIKYDNALKDYYTHSRKLGNPIEKYRYSLGVLRDEAFENFKNQNIYKEIDDKINQSVASKGQVWFDATIHEIQINESYLEAHSSLSPNEENQINQPNFITIKKLIEQEINFISKP